MGCKCCTLAGTGRSWSENWIALCSVSFPQGLPLLLASWGAAAVVCVETTSQTTTPPNLRSVLDFIPIIESVATFTASKAQRGLGSRHESKEELLLQISLSLDKICKYVAGFFCCLFCF